MRSPRVVSLAALLVGAAFGFLAACDPALASSGDPPEGVSDKVCFSDSDCAPNGCCGQGTNPTHVSEAPDCRAVRCDGSCPANSIDCGRCIAVCRDSRCAAACQ